MGFDILSYAIGVQAGKKSGGGSGGGGGSLTPGVYLSAASFPQPSSYRYKVFKYNGDLYATSCKYTSAGYADYLHKLNKETNKWTTIMTASGSYGINNSYIDSTAWAGIEHNGKFHILSGNRHNVFDGTNLTQISSSAPSSAKKMVEYDGKLYAYGTFDFKLKVFDETNNTWNDTGLERYIPAGVISGELYLINSKKLYRYNDGTPQEVMSLTASASPDETFFVNNTIYFIGSSNGGRSNIQKIDLEAGTEVTVGLLPNFASKFYSVNTDDISFVGITNNTTASYVPFFVVNIVE